MPVASDSTLNFVESAVRRTLESCRGSIMIIGLSGGADSTALTVALARSALEFSLELHCLHIDHGLRPEAEREADILAVRRLCATYRLPLRVVRIKPGRIDDLAKRWGGGVEDAARRVRRRLWRREARRLGARGVALGHNADDQLENLLMRIFRGAGPAGLAVWPTVRSTPGLLLLRPLLGVNRSRIEAFLSDLGLGFRTDSTNTKPIYLRNRVRLILMPLLDTSFSGWRSGLSAFGRIQTAVANQLAVAARQSVTWETKAGALTASAATFDGLDETVRVEALFQAIDALGRVFPRRSTGFMADLSVRVRPPSRSSLERFVRGETRAADLGFCRLRRSDDGRIRVERAVRGQPASGACRFISEPGRYRFSGWRVVVKKANSDDQSHGAIGSESGVGRMVWPIDLPCVVRSPSSGEVSGLVGMDRSVVVEDSGGVVAIFGRDAAGGIRTAAVAAGQPTTGYARSDFFFILIGYSSESAPLTTPADRSRQ